MRKFYNLSTVFLLSLFCFSNCFSALNIMSSAFRDKQTLPIKYSCDGQDLSPPLSWENVPKGTSSFVIICEDRDAPLGTWDHWIIYDIPAKFKKLDEGFGKKDLASLTGGIKQGKNSFKRFGYGGACPPRGDRPHRYIFKIYALDIKKLKFDGGKDVTKDMVIKEMKGHVLERSAIMAIFSRKL